MTSETCEENAGPESAKLPKQEHAHHIRVQDLARLLTKKAVISEDEFEWLVTQGYCIPRLLAMNEENWMQLRQELVAFLRPKVEKSQAE